MQVSLSNAYVDQLNHLFKKVKNISEEPLIYNFDNNSAVGFSNQTIEFVKAKFPRSGICNTLFELGKKHGVKIEDFNKQKKKATGATTSGEYLSNTMQVIDRIGIMWNSTTSTGFIAINVPTCYNDNWISFQPNLMKEIARQNEAGTSYFRISDFSNNYEKPVDIDINEASYRELMHKFQHTYRIKMGVTFVKENNTSKFVFKEDK